MEHKHTKIPRICFNCDISFNGCEDVCLKLEAAENAEKAVKREKILSAYANDQINKAQIKNKNHKRR